MTKTEIIRKLVAIRITRRILLLVLRVFQQNDKIAGVDNELFPKLNLESALKSIREHGYFKDFALSKVHLEKLIDRCQNHAVIAKGDRAKVMVVDYYNPKNSYPDECQYDYGDVEGWKEVDDILRSNKILNIARSYLGVEPVVHNTTIWWSFPLLTQDGEIIETDYYGYHYDIDDVKFLKLFIYLNDVDDKTGPHVVVSGSHRKRSWKTILNRRLNNDVAERWFKNRFVTITGEAGSAFFEDTFAYHKGSTPINPRLVFQVEFGVMKKKLG